MSRKRTSALLGSIKEKGLKLESNSLAIYSSNFDYEKFEIIDIKNELIKSEEKIFSNLKKIGKATFEVAEELYKVNKKLANYRGGTYMAWCSALGINKDRSSVLLRKYRLYLETDKKETMELPIPVIKTLTSNKNNFTTDEVLTVIEAEKPSLKLREIETQYSQIANTETCEVEDAKIIEPKEVKMITKEDLITRKEQLKKENQEIQKIIEKNLDEINEIDNILEK